MSAEGDVEAAAEGDEDAHVLTELVRLRESPPSEGAAAAGVLLLEVHCVPCRLVDDRGKGFEGRRTARWMTKALWSELLELLSPLAEGTLASGDEGGAKRDKKGTQAAAEEAVVLEGDNLRLAAAARKHNFDTLRLVGSPRRVLHPRKLVVGAALKSSADPASEVGRSIHRAVGARFDAQKINHYFAAKD